MISKIGRFLEGGKVSRNLSPFPNLVSVFLFFVQKLLRRFVCILIYVYLFLQHLGTPSDFVEFS